MHAFDMQASYALLRIFQGILEQTETGSGIGGCCRFICNPCGNQRGSTCRCRRASSCWPASPTSACGTTWSRCALIICTMFAVQRCSILLNRRLDFCEGCRAPVHGDLAIRESKFADGGNVQRRGRTGLVLRRQRWCSSCRSCSTRTPRRVLAYTCVPHTAVPACCRTTALRNGGTSGNACGAAM